MCAMDKPRAHRKPHIYGHFDVYNNSLFYMKEVVAALVGTIMYGTMVGKNKLPLFSAEVSTLGGSGEGI
jgi:hypothetical protein